MLHVALMLSLGACETARSNVLATCAPLVDYSPTFMQEAADELAAVSRQGYVRIPQMIEDYGQMRAILRAKPD